MKVVESSEEKVSKVLSALDKEKEKKTEDSVPSWLHEREMTMLETSNKRLFLLSVSGWIITLGVIVYTILTRTH